MTKVIIDRQTWYRGNSGVSSALRRPHDSKMCCLGFASLQAWGLTPHQIHGVRSPYGLGERRPDVCTKHARVIDSMIEVNDMMFMGFDSPIKTEAERESLLTELAAKIGLEFEFIN